MFAGFHRGASPVKQGVRVLFLFIGDRSCHSCLLTFYCLPAGAAVFGNGRGVTSAGETSSAHLMPSKTIFWNLGLSQVTSYSPQPTLYTRPLPYCCAHTTGKSPSALMARCCSVSEAGSSRRTT